MGMLLLIIFVLGLLSMITSKLNISFGKSVVGFGIIAIVLPEVGLVLLVISIITIIVLGALGR